MGYLVTERSRDMTNSDDCCNSGGDFLDGRRLREDALKGLRLGRGTPGRRRGNAVQGVPAANAKETKRRVPRQ